MKTTQHGNPPSHHVEDIILLRDESEAIHTWLKGQSISHLKDFAKFMQMTLSSMLQVELDHNARFKLLELFHPAVEHICLTLGNHYLDPNTPPAEKNLQVINLAQQLEMTIVSQYLAVIKSLIRIKYCKEAEDLMGASIYHSMIHLSGILLRSYEFYAPTYPQAWYCLHQLYQYADIYKLLHYMPEMEESSARQTNSIRQIYLETLLLGIATPYELQHHDLHLIISMLPQWSSHVTLSGLNQGIGDFVVHIDKDIPPFRHEFMRVEETGDRYRLLDIKSLEQHLHSLLAQSQQTAPPTSETIRIPAYILEQLIQAWSKATPRRYPRVMMRGRLRVVAGLSNLHHYVNLQPGTEESLPTSSKKQPAISTWQIVDTSPNGYCLKMPYNAQIRLHAGELVGLQEEDEISLTRWGIGMIRWVKHGVDDSYNIGIQLIAPTGTPIHFYMQNNAEQPSEGIPGFLLPGLARLQQEKTLLLPVLPFHEGDVLNIKTEDSRYDVQLSTLTHRTSSFMQYQFMEPGTNPA